MKKVISIVVLGALLAVLLLPAVVSAQPETVKDSCTLKRDLSDVDTACTIANNPIDQEVTESWGMCCLVNTVYNVTNWIFYLLMIFVVVMVVIGGATYMLASGDPEKAGKGKSIIIYGIVGLVIALLARLIPSVVKLIVGMG